MTTHIPYADPSDDDGNASSASGKEESAGKNNRQDGEPETLKRLSRLYDLASAIEAHCTDERAKDAAREIALMALDMLAELRAKI